MLKKIKQDKLKNTKRFSIKLFSGKTINKFGKNIIVYTDGILFVEDRAFIPKEQIEEIREYKMKPKGK